MASVSFTGRLGADPVLKGEGENQFGVVSIAESYFAGAGKGDLRDGKPTDYKTQWFSAVAFGKQGVYLVESFHSGDIIAVQSGEVSLSTFEKKDKTQGAELKLVLNKFSGPYSSVRKGEARGAAEQQVPQQQAPQQRQAAAPARAQQAATATRRTTNVPSPSTEIDDSEIPF